MLERNDAVIKMYDSEASCQRMNTLSDKEKYRERNVVPYAGFGSLEQYF